MSTDQPDAPHLTAPIQVASLNGRRSREVLIEPDAATCAQVARFLNLSALRKFRFHGRLDPSGARDWTLSGSLGATVEQPCGVTLAPVTTRIDERVIRHYVADWHEPEGGEVEMTVDPTIDPLGTRIDLSSAVTEALALAVPDFPRAPGVALSRDGSLRAAPSGQTPLDDDAVKPFAALRDKLNRP